MKPTQPRYGNTFGKVSTPNVLASAPARHAGQVCREVAQANPPERERALETEESDFTYGYLTYRSLERQPQVWVDSDRHWNRAHG